MKATVISLGLIVSGSSVLANRTVYPLRHSARLTPMNGVKAVPTVYRGKRALELIQSQDPKFGGLGMLFPDDFKDGTIEFDATGNLTDLHNPTSRSFVGIGFHVSDDLGKYECFYLRMTNGRSSSQELRNHAVQYCMFPDHIWNELRAKRPFRYEAYTDIALGEWTHVKVSVHGSEAKFYVGGAKQPTLIVHDLFMGPTHGKIGLWVGGYTRAYYANMRVHST